MASGLVTEAEAGWPPGARRAALDRMTEGELALLAGERLQALGKALRRHEHELDHNNRIWENLG